MTSFIYNKQTIEVEEDTYSSAERDILNELKLTQLVLYPLAEEILTLIRLKQPISPVLSSRLLELNEKDKYLIFQVKKFIDLDDVI